MKKFRKFMIDFYFGNYNVKNPFNKKYLFISRAAVSNFSLLFALMVATYFTGRDNTISVILFLLGFAWIVYSSFPFSLSYFQTNPVVWKELNTEDKWYLGNYYMSIGNPNLSSEKFNYEEWKAIDAVLKNKYF
jgi:hypothetical protein